MTIRGLSGSLLSQEALAGSDVYAQLAQTTGGTEPAAPREFRTWYAGVRSALGPTASARTVLDTIALPLATHLGYQPIILNRTGVVPYALLQVNGRDTAVLLVTPWGDEPDRAWRDAVKRGIAHDVRWCFCVTGPSIRLFDARRAYSRRFAEFDLSAALDDAVTSSVFWVLLKADATAATGGLPVLDRAVELCERHRTAVRHSLKNGVREALVELGAAFLAKGHHPAAHRAVDESLTVIYRVLFLLFAEARGLVPHWHPSYRNYTVESLRPAVEASTAPRGLWEALQAINRLAHRGCRAGSLRVPPFNGRLFSPADAPLAESVRLDDRAVGRALMALTTRLTKDRRERIAYADLGVEQLGAVYEHVLDFVANDSSVPGRLELQSGAIRKTTGTFYTPRSLTEYLVRRTLGPLVQEASPEQILRLRVLDPAMGSGAFLVAACRYLAHAYEHALIRDQGLPPSDITNVDRTSFRRLIAQSCLFGVDLNPMAVQLARLSLWLATLAGDRPLTFLDHHLRDGDSLIGASLADIHRQPPDGRGRRGRPSPLPLFSMSEFESQLQAIVTPRLELARNAEDTLEQVKHKERTLARLSGENGPLARWKLAADLWCAAWFVGTGDRRLFDSLVHEAITGQAALPPHVSTPIVDQARVVATSRRFFHWTLEFPEAFFDEAGRPLGEPGFDAILGNPPWEMLRADKHAEKAATMRAASELGRFARSSGIYTLQSTGHSNLYQLFVERALSVLKPAGRLGFIVPAGLASDHGSAALRRELLDRTTIDTFTICDNRDRLFPIHRSVKFTLLTLTKAGHTSVLPLRTGIRSADILDTLPDVGDDDSAVSVPRLLLTRVTGELAAIPDVRSALDLELLSRISSAHRPLGDPEGWGAEFGRELNATDDRPHFGSDVAGLPVVEGKHIQPFRVDGQNTRFTILHRHAARLLPNRPYALPRLAYRDVASATNRLTLIAAIVPAGVVTTHTVFCLKTRLGLEEQRFVCALFNSFVANFLVRMRVTTHVSTAVIEQLPVPKPARTHPMFRELAGLAEHLSTGGAPELHARQQALAALVYGLDVGHFSHVLESFPLVSRCERQAALEIFRCIVGTEDLRASGAGSSRTA